MLWHQLNYLLHRVTSSVVPQNFQCMTCFSDNSSSRLLDPTCPEIPRMGANQHFYQLTVVVRVTWESLPPHLFWLGSGYNWLSRGHGEYYFEAKVYRIRALKKKYSCIVTLPQILWRLRALDVTTEAFLIGFVVPIEQKNSHSCFSASLVAELELSTLDADVDDVDDVDGRCVARKLNLVSSLSSFLRSRYIFFFLPNRK